MLQSLPQPVKEDHLKLTAIKAKIDSKFENLYKLLNNIPIIIKDDKNCQTSDLDIVNPQRDSLLNFEVDNSNKKNAQMVLTINNNPNRSISMMSERVSKQSHSVSKNSKEGSQKVHSDNNSVNKSSGSHSTSKNQRIKSKLITKNTNYEKIIKQRQFQKELQASIKPMPTRDPIIIKNQNLQLMLCSLQQRVKLERSQQNFDNKTRKKLINKVLQMQKQKPKINI